MGPGSVCHRRRPGCPVVTERGPTLAAWGTGAEQSSGADCLQRPLVPRSRSWQRLKAGVGRWMRHSQFEEVVNMDIDQLTEAELIALHYRIVERLRFMEQMRAHSTMLAFSIGERVTFSREGRPPVTGMVVKYNKKTVTVITDDGQRWNVSPSFLRKAEPKAVTPIKGKVIPMKSPR
jgi:hypothetical protein